MNNELQRLIDIVAKLRSPEGCPWDREQTHRSILTCLLDEAYEFFEAVDEKSDEMMREELGDLLLQIVLHAQIASEEKRFDIETVAKGISDKLIRRHPHVFSEKADITPEETIRNWERIKKSEYAGDRRKYMVDDIPDALPALFRSEKMQRRVAQAGFDWSSAGPALDKVEEEFAEFREAIENGNAKNAEEELGDIMFALVNVARHYKISAENALRATTYKFAQRFRFVEDKFRELGKDMKDAPLEEMDKYWEMAKLKS